MKRHLLAAIAVVCMFAPVVQAQRPSPKLVQLKPRAQAAAIQAVLWTWGAPAVGANGVAAATYNFYQAASACPGSGIPSGAAEIASGLTATSYTQSPAPANITCSYVTAVSAAGVEGPPSNTFQLNLGAPGAPTALIGSPTTN